MRAVLLDRVQPLVDRFAKQLANLLVEDVERRLLQLGEAFDVALSTFAAELATTTDVCGAGSPPSPGVTVPEAAVAAEQASTSRRGAGRTTPGMTVPGAAVVADEAPTSTAHASLETRDREALQSRPAPRVQAPVGGPRKRTMTCSKCGAVGFTAQSCGKTHNVAGAAPERKSTPAIAATSTVSPPPTHGSRLDVLREAAARREEAKRERDERSRSFIRRGGDSTEPPPDDIDDEPRAPTLPEALASFDL